MKDIAHHTQDAITMDFWAAQPATCPDHHVMGQRAKQHQYMLRLKALLVAFGETPPLLVALETGFDASPTLIIEVHIGRQDGDRISRLRAGAVQHGEYLLSRQRADQHAIGEGAILSATAHCQAPDRAHIAGRGFGHPAEGALGPVRVLNPLGNRLDQAQHTSPRILLGHDLIAASQQPIEVIQSPGTSIHADNRACPFRLVQLQSRLSCFHQGLQSLDQLDIARKEAIHRHFLILAGQYAAHLPPPAVVLPGKVALGGKSRFGAARQAAHIHIQQEKTGLVVMLNALAVLSIDLIERLLQLRHSVWAGIQGFLHHRLFSTRASAKGLLQGRIGSQAGVDFDQSVNSGQQADKGIIELVGRRMLDGFLPDLHRGANRAKEIELTQFHSNGCQAGGLKWFVVRVIDSFMVILLAHENCFGSSVAMEHRHAFGKLFQG